MTSLFAENAGRVFAEPFDVTDPAAVSQGVARAEADAGPIDILVNNVGMTHRGGCPGSRGTSVTGPVAFRPLLDRTRVV